MRIPCHLVSFSIIASALAGCMTLPTYTPIHDDKQAVVAQDTDIGQQVLYKGETLTHYRIEGVDAYCTGLVSMDLSLYRCFAMEGDKLVKGLIPNTSDWISLSHPVPISK